MSIYVRDLQGALDKTIESGLLDEVSATGTPAPLAEALERRKATLGELAWSRWAAEQGESPHAPLPDLLVQAARGAEHAEAQLDRVLGQARTPELREALEAPNAQELEVVWSYVSARLALLRRRLVDLDREVKGQDIRAGRAIAEQLSLPFQLIESLLLSYFRLRARLQGAGWKQVEQRLGRRLSRTQLDPARHQIEEGDDAELFEVRSLGIQVGSEVVYKAVVKGLAAESDLGRE